MEPKALDYDLSSLPEDKDLRHEVFVEFFGQIMFALRNGILQSTRDLIESADKRDRLSVVMQRYYEGVGQMSQDQREAAMALVETTLNRFALELCEVLGHQGSRARIGTRDAYRFRLVMEIVDPETLKIYDEETLNRGGKSFGRYWGRWLNRYSSLKPS